jgi:SPX domain protein involved in polyphosphate accumulation
MKNYTPLKKKRFERKFVIDVLSRPNVEQIIKLHPLAFSEIYQQRTVNNIYFDTGKLSFFFDNISGYSDRKKYRIRWYGKTFGTVDDPVLEIKIKHGHVGQKLSFPLKSFQLNKQINKTFLHEIIQSSDVPSTINEELRYLRPVILNSYTRKYFQSFNREFRITIDDKLSFYNINDNQNNFLWSEKDDTTVIVELKYDHDKDGIAETVTNSFPFRLNKSSKYVKGVHFFHNNVPL